MDNKIKILHIAPDEKFIKAADWIFEQAFPHQNTFVILLKNTKLKFVEKRHDYIYSYPSKDFFKQILESLPQYDIVILHGLYDFQSRLVLKAYRKTKFVWILFGGEVYNNSYVFDNQIYGKLTFEKFVKKEPFRKLKYLFRPLYYLIVKRKQVPSRNIKKAAKKVYAIGIIHREDYELFVKKRILKPNTKHLKFTYYPIEFIFDNSEKQIVNGNNILFGNSASSSNNHLEAFNLLTQLNLENRKVITPLSYGNEDYAKEIIKAGEEKLGKNFVPLIDFLPVEEYNKKVQSCGITIMNHYRQQAVGNVLAMLWMGSKVFLDERNTFYHYLKRIGCKVFSISEDFVSGNNNALELLPKEDIELNRKIIFEEINAEKIINGLKMDLTSYTLTNK